MKQPDQVSLPPTEEVTQLSQTVTQLIRNRRSVYADDYQKRAIPRDTLEEILTNATWAPTHKMTEPWRFVVLQGSKLADYGEFMATYYQHLYQDMPEPEKREAKYRYLKEYPRNAACVVAIILVRSEKINIPEWEEIAAVSCAVQNIALSCSSFHLGSYWATGGAAMDYVNTLGLAPNERSMGLFFIGHYDREQYQVTKKRTPLSQKITWMD